MDLSALRLAASAVELLVACRLAPGVDLLDDEPLAPLQGIVPSDPPQHVHIGRHWGSAFRCTCGAYSESSTALAKLCPHAAAVLLAWLAGDSDDPAATISSFTRDVEPFAMLEQGLAEVFSRAVERDEDGSDMATFLEGNLDLLGLELDPAVAGSRLRRHASRAQLGRYMMDTVEHLLGEAGDGHLGAGSISNALRAWNLSGFGAAEPGTAFFDALLHTVRRIWTVSNEGEKDLWWREHFIVACHRVLVSDLPPGDSRGTTLVRTIVGLHEEYRETQAPLMARLVQHWDDELCSIATADVERRIGSLLTLIDSDDMTPSQRSFDSRPLELALEADDMFQEHRFADAGRSSAELIPERSDRLCRLAVDLAFRQRHLDRFERALRRWQGAAFAEYFLLARHWSREAQLTVLTVAEDRGCVRWASDHGPLLVSNSAQRSFPGEDPVIGDRVAIHDQALSPERLHRLEIQEVVRGLCAAGLPGEAANALQRHLRRDPDPRRVPEFVRCWEGAGLSGDPLETAVGILRGDPPG